MSSTCDGGSGGGGGGGAPQCEYNRTSRAVYSQVEVASSCTVWPWLLPTSQTVRQFSILNWNCQKEIPAVSSDSQYCLAGRRTDNKWGTTQTDPQSLMIVRRDASREHLCKCLQCSVLSVHVSSESETDRREQQKYNKKHSDNYCVSQSRSRKFSRGGHQNWQGWTSQLYTFLVYN